MTKPAGLNTKTLQSLAGLARHQTQGAQLLQLPLEQIDEDPNNPRRNFDPQALEDLAATIKEQGLILPIVVRDNGAGRYILVDGARRLRAHQIAGLSTITAVRQTRIGSVVTAQLVANDQREALNPLEIGSALKRALAEDPERFPNAAALAKYVGRSKAWIYKYLGAADVTADVAALVETGRVSTVERVLELNSLEQDEKQRVIAAINAGATYADAVRLPAPPEAASGAAEKSSAPQSGRSARKGVSDTIIRDVHRLASALGLPTPAVKASEKGVVVAFSLGTGELAALISKHVRR